MKTPMTFEILEISPGMAQLWLETRGPNRRLRMGHVRELATEMKAGRWVITHQGIAFGPDGKIVDGQHRLSAIVMAGFPVTMLVSFYAEAAPLLLIDSISPKSLADRLTISSRPDLTSAHVAVTRAFWTGGFSGQASGGPAVTDAVVASVLDRFWDAVVFGSGVTLCRVRGVGSAIVGGAISRAWLHEDHERLAQFMDVLKTGLPSSLVDDQAAISLREQLIGIPNVANGRLRRDTFLKTQRAAKAFCTREPLKLIRAPERDIYPLPNFNPYGEGVR